MSLPPRTPGLSLALSILSVASAIFALIMLAFIGSALFAMHNPCATEDSHNCTWDARHRGDGTGQSFIDVWGLTAPTTPTTR